MNHLTAGRMPPFPNLLLYSCGENRHHGGVCCGRTKQWLGCRQGKEGPRVSIDLSLMWLHWSRVPSPPRMGAGW